MKQSLLCLALLTACGSTDANKVPSAKPVLEQAKAPPEVVDEQLVANEWTGELKGHASTVTLAHSTGVYDIDAFEASLDGVGAVSAPGAAAKVNITWYDARDACEHAGKRLCSEEEWLIACTGASPIDRDRDTRFSDDPIQGRAYPYGMA
ncbi:MAG: hypothetical protein GWP91_18765, partial [Rhodobacterales bacterium]|nr:hypothetical protein [Rhodobacterales bacterium]